MSTVTKAMTTTCPCPSMCACSCPSWCQDDTCEGEHSRILRTIPATGGPVLSRLEGAASGTVPSVTVGLLRNDVEFDDAPGVSLDVIDSVGVYLRVHEARALIVELTVAVHLLTEAEPQGPDGGRR